MRLLGTLLSLVFLPAAVANADTTALFTLPSGVKVQIIEAPFDPSRFKVEGCSGTSEVCRIDGHVPFGTAFGLPRTYVKSIIISFQGHSYSLDVSDMYNAWGSRPLEYKGVIRYFGGKCFDLRNCQFRGLFSDAAASFVAEWGIINGIALRTVLTGSDDVIDLFMKNIDPPEYE